MPNQQSAYCTAAIGTMTQAIKAQRALLDAGIFGEVRSLLPEQTHRGCAFGVAFPCSETRAVRTALHAARIPVSQYLGRDGASP